MSAPCLWTQRSKQTKTRLTTTERPSTTRIIHSNRYSLILGRDRGLICTHTNTLHCSPSHTTAHPHTPLLTHTLHCSDTHTLHQSGTCFLLIHTLHCSHVSDGETVGLFFSFLYFSPLSPPPSPSVPIWSSRECCVCTSS